MSQCKPIALFDRVDIKLSTCACCKRIGLQFKNLLYAFSMADFETFRTCILNLKFDKQVVDFPDGQGQVVIKTCHSDIQFCFSESELKDLKTALDEASLMIEVHAALQTN
ncbi:MAG: hypothetical protein ACJAVN_000197 [Roseivirga sp.]|jgi:hypothetical protein